MTLYSYTIATDSGFAPNPFHGLCTLACCKPGIRRTAQEGDYVVGIGPKKFGSRIVYAMLVTETVAFDDYWHDKRFRTKRPKIDGGGEKALGDNIYHLGRAGQRQLFWPLCANYFGRSGSGVIVVCNCRSCACRPCASLVR